MRRRLLWLAAACAVAFVVVGIVFVGTRAGQRADDAAYRGRSARNPEAVARARDLLQSISIGSVALGGGAAVMAAAAKRNLRLMVTVLVVIAGSIALSEFLKHVVISRPDLLKFQAGERGNTFPSGHTATATSLAVAALLVVPARWRSWVAVVAAFYSAAVGVSTLTAGAHRPSDAVGAIILTVGIGALATAWLTAVPSASIDVALGRVAERGLAMLGALLLTAGGAVAAVYVWTTKYNRLRVVTLGRANFGAAVSIAGTALLSFGLLLVAMRRDHAPG